MKTKSRLRGNLERILGELKRYEPDKIILFGSLSRHEEDEYSDIDLIVIKDTPEPFLKRLRRVALLCESDEGADILVYTPGEIERMRKSGNPLVIEAEKHGEVVYERQ